MDFQQQETKQETPTFGDCVYNAYKTDAVGKNMGWMMTPFDNVM